MKYDTVIIGGGPAGLTAGLYAGRSKLRACILEKNSFGGQVLLTELIENYPGIYRMNSFDWVETIKKQLAELERLELREGSGVDELNKLKQGYRLRLSAGTGREDHIEANSVILAMGTRPKKLCVPGEEKLIGKGVSFCATCDGPLFKDKEVVLVGGGEAALEEALYLSRFAKSVTILHRRSGLRASALMQERVAKEKKIRLKLEFVPVEVLGVLRVEGLIVRNVNDQKTETIQCDGIFVFIGSEPDTSFLSSIEGLKLDNGYILTDEQMMTSLPGVFACGDCRKRPFNQVVTACAEGAIAAFFASRYLEQSAP